MDEPLSNLDDKLRNQMRSEILMLREKIKTTFVYVTHVQTEAMTLGDRIAIMKDGYVMQVGTPAELVNRPANLFGSRDGRNFSVPDAVPVPSDSKTDTHK